MYSVQKINGRLWVVDSDLNKVYTVPDTLRSYIRDRSELKTLVVDRLNNSENYADVVRLFEMHLLNRHLIRTSGFEHFLKYYILKDTQ